MRGSGRSLGEMGRLSHGHVERRPPVHMPVTVRTCHPRSWMARFAQVETFVIRVWLPDRPGALGQVASRIGAVRGDVMGIEILERGGGQAVDDLVVALADPGLIDLLVAEVMQVDGVAVEDVRRVSADRTDTGIVALQLVADLAEADIDRRLDLMGHQLLELVDGAWSAVIDVRAERALCMNGAPPDEAWLMAFVHGSRHLEPDHHDGGPGDLAWGTVPGGEVVVAVGRAGRPFHTRERQQISLYCRVAGALVPAIVA